MNKAKHWRANFGLLLLMFAAAAVAQIPEPADYRQEDYRSPVPLTLQGAEVVDGAGLLGRLPQLVVIDVLPQMARPPRLAPDNLWLPPAHEGIPGAIWLPNVGYGTLPPALLDYFDDGLRIASGGDHDRPLLFYCRSECWHSWNAAKRALSLGYHQVLWYPDGIDGWLAAGQRAEILRPFRDGPPA